MAQSGVRKQPRPAVWQCGRGMGGRQRRRISGTRASRPSANRSDAISAASHWTLRGFRHPSGILRSQRSGISRLFRCVPDYFTTHPLSYLREPSGAKAIRRLAQLTPEYEALFRRLASESGLYIVAGTHPLIQEGQLFNAAHLFTPNGRIFRQKRVHLTQTEKAWYQIGRGHGFYVYHTDFGKIAILVCYDVRIPQSGARAGRERSADSLRSLVH